MGQNDKRFSENSFRANLPVNLETISRKSLERIKGFNTLHICKSDSYFFSFFFSPLIRLPNEANSFTLRLEEISLRPLHC